jgi:hypothetical protein
VSLSVRLLPPLQVAGSGFVFGAYTHVAWPQRPAYSSSNVIVADPSKRSFLFSLVNGENRPFVVPLVDSTRALIVTDRDELAFGASTSIANNSIQLIGQCMRANAANS